MPFTPVTGPRLLVRAGADTDAVRQTLLATVGQLGRQNVSGDVDYPDMKKHGYMHNPEFYYQHGLNKEQRARVLQDARRFRGE